MNAAYLKELKSAYPVKMAMDEDTPTERLQKAMANLAELWERRFTFLARSVANRFAEESLRGSDFQFKTALARSGFTVQFQLTPAMKNNIQAIVAENVSLIKSIPRQYHTNIESIVMQSVTRGRDTAYLFRELKHQYGVTDRRAKLIAYDQNNKATSALTQTRQTDLGITRGIWMHSHAGRKPRPSHLASDGKEFDISKGLFLDGKWTMPGELINCRCTWKPILPWKVKKLPSE